MVGTIVLNQNNKAVHAKTASDRDIPGRHYSPGNSIHGPQLGWHKDAAATASFDQQTAIQLSLSVITVGYTIKSQSASTGLQALSITVKWLLSPLIKSVS